VAARLEIEPIHALTPQARGRVERAIRTLQDRLVKALRLRGIGSMAAAHDFLPAFMTVWNAKFAVEARAPGSAHRPWTRTPAALDEALARRGARSGCCRRR
jgi:hypothetical protein